MRIDARRDNFYLNIEFLLPGSSNLSICFFIYFCAFFSHFLRDHTLVSKYLKVWRWYLLSLLIFCVLGLQSDSLYGVMPFLNESKSCEWCSWMSTYERIFETRTKKSSNKITALIQIKDLIQQDKREREIRMMQNLSKSGVLFLDWRTVVWCFAWQIGLGRYWASNNTEKQTQCRPRLNLVIFCDFPD